MKSYNIKSLPFILLMAMCTQFSVAQKKAVASKKQPNIIFILTDDLGYGDVGVFFQNLRKEKDEREEPYHLTPMLDKMAKEGAMFTNQYAAAPVCAPSRASLLSGLSQGHANVRDNQFDRALADNYTLGNVMQLSGYKTATIGKWGLQGNKKYDVLDEKWPAHPLKRGFDYYMGYISHGDGHEHYPKEGPSKQHNGGPKKVYEGYKEISEQLDKCYTGDLFTAVAKKWIVENSGKTDKPFFMYLAYDTPHAVLELPTQAYPAGGGLTGGLQWLDKPGHMINTASGKIDSWIHPDYINKTYDNDNNPKTPEVEWPNVYKRYATAVRRIDDQVGDLLKVLADLKIDDNTLVVFTSDNGPSIESYLKEPYRADFFNSFGPFDGVKRDVLEGGMRMPTIARWPSKIPAEQVIAKPSMMYDWLPTFTAMAGLPAPANSDGVSLLPILTKQGKQDTSLVYSEYFEGGRSPNYEEFAKNNRVKSRKQMQMLRVGDLVGLRYDIKSASDDFEIYDVTKDPHQTKNLATSPEMQSLQNYMKERVLQIRRSDSTAQRPYDTAAIPSVNIVKPQKGVNWESFENHYKWLPNVSHLNAVDKGSLKAIDVESVKSKKDLIYVFEGYIYVPSDGKYNFHVSTSTKAFVRIHNASVIDADYGYQANTTKANSLILKSGYHPIKIYYSYKVNSENKLDIKWGNASSNKHQTLSNDLFIDKN
ncbi:sulfatase-like hydrolase/transferase [Pedobacter arcticus]|uniref:sulfatase-like hydrolase/transferase n=1 Tax=Pedobacter arcticus TaxID=752140 RepID=UPI0002E71856|nr:sulfatase-like hydrolase/transferase [Pedobacter arcticus]